LRRWSAGSPEPNGTQEIFHGLVEGLPMANGQDAGGEFGWIFLSAFGTLAISFWPYMVPFAITIDEAAAPHSSLAFMFWGEGLSSFR
jgi:cytochrome bd-type quinol oxidase subunit 2